MTTSTAFVDLRINNAEQLKESVSELTANTKMYLAFGKTDSWANESSPQIANSSTATVYEIWDNMIGGKRILGGDISHAIPRINWVANTIYTAYDHMNTNLYDGNTEFYVMTSNYSVYKCISNNRSSISTVEPTSQSFDTVSSTSDGYKWKYMYTLSDAEQLKFMTDNYISVKTLSEDDGSQQWQVQSLSTDGSIEHIEVVNSGSNYTNTSNIIINIQGDGNNAKATVTLNTSTNTVSSITITDTGSGYTHATATITGGGGSGAIVRPIISPPNGHGSDPLYELGGKNLILNIRLRYDEEGILPVTNDYRQVSIVKDPLNFATSNVSSVTAFLQATTLTTVGTGDYSEDEFVYQGANLSTATFKGRVVSWDPVTGKVYVINTEGTPIAAQPLSGQSSFTVRTISNILDGEMKKYSGNILFADNIKPVTRSTDQIENYKIVLRF